MNYKKFHEKQEGRRKKSKGAEEDKKMRGRNVKPESQKLEKKRKQMRREEMIRRVKD